MTVATQLSPLQRLEIREACQQLALDYSFHADAGAWDPWSRLFAEDGEMHLSGAVLKGPAAIRKAVGGAAAASALTVHAISNHRIDVVSENEARGTVHIVLYTAERKAGQPATAATLAPAIVGTYHDTYRRTAEGWKFAQRRFEPLITAAQS
jgi:hypothetical protein